LLISRSSKSAFAYRLDSTLTTQVENRIVCSTLWIFQHWTLPLWSGLFGAAVGGVISGFGSWLAAKSQAKAAFEVQQREFLDREKQNKRADDDFIRGTVQSISDEVEALWKHYNREIGPHFASLQADRAANVFHASQNYFVIFNAAGALVGRIPCETLRSRIIDFYVGAKACVDSLQYYERLNDYYAAISDHNLRLEKWQQILEYSKQLKTMNVEFRKLYDALRPELDRYLSATRSGL
jgi:hypothetical protein